MKKLTTIIIVLLSICKTNSVNAQGPNEASKLNWVIQMFELVPDTPEMVHREGRHEAQQAYRKFFPSDDSLYLDFQPWDVKNEKDLYFIMPRTKNQRDIKVCENLINMGKILVESYRKAIGNDTGNGKYTSHTFLYSGGKIKVMKCRPEDNYAIATTSKPFMTWWYKPNPSKGIRQVEGIVMEVPKGYHLPKWKDYIIPDYYWQEEFSKLVTKIKTEVVSPHKFTSIKGSTESF